MEWTTETSRPTLSHRRPTRRRQRRFTSGHRRYAPMATMDFTPTVAHPMVTTGLSFSLAACLSVRVRGTVADSMAAADLTVAVVSMAVADLTGAVGSTVVVDSMVADLTVAVGSTVVVDSTAEDLTVVVDSTAVVDPTAAVDHMAAVDHTAAVVPGVVVTGNSNCIL